MPELPDLTIFAESLRDLVLDREIATATYHRRQRINIPPERFDPLLRGRRFTDVSRAGKEILFTLDSGDRFLVHLMLAGGFTLVPAGQEPPFAILTIEFRDGEALVVTDPKGWVTVTVNPDLSRQPTDALEVTSSYLQWLFSRRPRAILKALLLDQQALAGIGNAYSDEILWQARLSPKSIVGRIPPEGVERLAEAIRSVLAHAVDHLRRTHAGIISGEVRDFLAVHNPRKRKSPGGAPIMVDQVAGKKTYYTDEQVQY